MKCLLCKFASNDKLEIETHYLKFHNVDKDMFFSEDYSIKRTMFLLVKNVQVVMNLFQRQISNSLMIF